LWTEWLPTRLSLRAGRARVVPSRSPRSRRAGTERQAGGRPGRRPGRPAAPADAGLGSAAGRRPRPRGSSRRRQTGGTPRRAARCARPAWPGREAARPTPGQWREPVADPGALRDVAALQVLPPRHPGRSVVPERGEHLQPAAGRVVGDQVAVVCSELAAWQKRDRPSRPSGSWCGSRYSVRSQPANWGRTTAWPPCPGAVRQTASGVSPFGTQST
jgi:hypothetical protein